MGEALSAPIETSSLRSRAITLDWTYSTNLRKVVMACDKLRLRNVTRIQCKLRLMMDTRLIIIATRNLVSYPKVHNIMSI